MGSGTIYQINIKGIIMCGQPAPTPQAMPAPIQQRNPDLTKAATLPDKKELLDPENVADVQYGEGTGTKKEDQRGAAKRQGTDALKINLNTGTGTGGQNINTGTP
jgi:hypothetical protein